MAGTIRENKTVLTAEDRTGGAFASMQKNIAGVEQQAMKMQAMFAGLAGGAIVGGFAAMIKGAVDAMAAMKDSAQEAGLMVTQLQRFEAPARLAGVSLGEVSGAMQKLSRSLVEAKDPVSNAALALKTFGINANELKGLSLDEQFEKIARASEKYAGSAEKNAALMELTGKSGATLQKLFAEMAAAGSLQASVTNEQAEAADELSDTWERVKMQQEAVARGTASALIPSLTAALKAFEDLNSTNTAWTATMELAGGVIRLFTGLVGSAWLALTDMGDALGAWMAKVAAFARGDLDGIQAINKARDEQYAKNEAAYEKLWANMRTTKKLAEEMPDAWDLQGSKKTAGYDPAAAAAARAAGEKLKAAAIRNTEQALRDYTKAAMDALKIDEDIERELAKLQDKRTEAILSTEKIIAQIEFETSIMGMSNDEREKAIALRALETSGIDKQDTAYQALNERLRAALDAQKAVRDEQEKFRTAVQIWDDVASAAGNFFGDLVVNGKSAFDNLKQSLKSFAADILAFFAKRYILQMVAGASGTFGSTAASAASSAAGSMGNSLMGTALGAAGAYLFGTAGAAAGTGTATALAGGGMIAANTATATYTTAGVIGQGGLMSTITSALSAIPVWGWIAIAAMAAYAAFGGKGGGPKTGGSFQGMFDASGNQTGTNATNLFGLQPGESTGDSAVASIASATAKSYYELVKAFGGNSRALNFGLGYDSDPRGTADNRIKAQVTDAAGNSIFKEWDRAIGRDQDKIAPELQLSAYRALLAALQASELPGEMGKLFASVVAATASQADIEALINTAKDLQYVMDGIAAAGIPDVTLESLRALQAAGESLGDVFNRVVGEFLTAQNNLNAAIGSRNPQFARDLVLSQRNGLAAQFATLVGRDFGDALLAQMALQPETFTNLNTAGMNLLANFLGLQTSLEQLDAQLAGSGTSAVVNFTNALVNSTSAITDARANLASYLQGSLLSDASPLSPMARYAEARRQYNENLALAQTDNVDAISNFGQYRDAFLAASRLVNASNGQYNTDFFGTYNQGANLPNSGVRPYTAADADRLAERSLAAMAVQSEKTQQVTQAVVALAAAVIDNASQNTAQTKAVLDDQLLALNKIANTGGALASTGALP